MPMVYTSSLPSKKKIQPKSRKVSQFQVRANSRIKGNESALASCVEPNIYQQMQSKTMVSDSDSDWNSSSDEEDDSGKKWKL